MREFSLEWDVGSDDAAGAGHRIGLGASACAREYISLEFADLAEMFPFNRQFHAEVEKSPDGWIAVRVQWEAGMQMPSVGKFKEEDLQNLHRNISSSAALRTGEIVQALGADWFGFDRFTYVGPIRGRRVSWPHIQIQVIEWLLTIVVPKIVALNMQRVQRAIPQPPMFDLAKIFSALWVLECDQESIQGTAFLLEGVGLVTCYHALGPTTVAFRYDKFGERFPVTVLKHNSTLDLAILAAPDVAAASLQPGQADHLGQMDHILVAGHPNYRHGDSPMATPGLIVGFRTVSGVRRLMTNAPIVAGISGGPVIDGSGKAVGVAVTGARTFSTAQMTEDHGIVPIEALSLL